MRFNVVNWGPRPFRFNNYWLDNKDFYGIVENYWRGCNITGWMTFVLKEKLKGLKAIVKAWHRETYGKGEEKIEKIILEISVLDLKCETTGLSAVDDGRRKSLFDEMWHLMKSKEAVLVQRSRARWLREGDTNTSYFHACINSRRNHNAIQALQTVNGWAESPTDIRQAVVSFFRNHFGSEAWVRPSLDGINFSVLSAEANLTLVQPFLMPEIEEVIRDTDGNKSPGPDDFNFTFVKSFWSLVKAEVFDLFTQFHGSAKLPRSFSSYFVSLIPKINSPFSLGDFRPISLLGCLYKIIAKVLTARLARVMNSIVEPTQSVFLKGRNLVDGVVVVNEVVDLARRNGQSCLILKVDFEKAYDLVEWSFLEYMLRRFGFCNKWIEWIRACVFSGNMSVLVNGCPTEEINIQRGLKQGDPLAPFLFLMVAEGLGGLMKKAAASNLFRGFRVGSNGLSISHLQYADDTLCLGEATIGNLWALKAILRGFEMVSGLKVNYWKSNLMGVNVSNDFLTVASAFLNCRVHSIPFKYLGLPIGANLRHASMWEPLLVSLRKRLGAWGNRYVSLGGRIVLLNSVLNAIHIFYLSFMKMPVQVWKSIQRIQREFLWGGRRRGKGIRWIK
jgi:hypothetical protein